MLLPLEFDSCLSPYLSGGDLSATKADGLITKNN